MEAIRFVSLGNSAKIKQNKIFDTTKRGNEKTNGYLTYPNKDVTRKLYTKVNVTLYINIAITMFFFSALFLSILAFHDVNF